MAASYLFDPSKGETPKSIAQQRQLATLLASRILGRAPKNVGEGLSSLGQALIARTMLNDANSAQKAGLASANSAFSSIASMLAGGSPSAAPTPTAAPVTPSIPTEALSGAPVSETAAPLSGGMLASPAAPTAGINVPDQYKPLVQSAAEKYGIPEGVLTRQLNTESRFNPTAVSPAGATGIAQFMPETAKDMGVNPADPASAIPGAARYVAQNRDRYGGNMTLALAAYNWGPGNVDKWLASGADPSKMPAETRKYVETILGPDALSRPVQVASNDPNFVPMSPAPMAQAAGGNALAFNGQPQNASPLSTLPPAAGPQGFAPSAGPAPNITTIPVRPTQLPIGGQTAQAATQTMQGPSTQTVQGPSMEVLLKAASNPFLSAGQRAVIDQMVKQRLETQQQSNDPLHQLQIEQARKNLGKSDAPASIQEYNFYRQQAQESGKEPLSYNEWQLQSKKAGATTINNNMAGGNFNKQLDKNVADSVMEQRSQARDAANVVKIINEGRGLLDSGAVTGALANYKVGALKLASSLGISVPQDAADNTQAFQAVMGQAVGMIIKQFGAGTGLSDADREYAQKIVGGDVTLNEAAIRRIFDISEKAARGRIEAWQKKVPAILKGDMSSMLSVPMPEAYTPKVNPGGTTSNGLQWSIEP